MTKTKKILLVIGLLVLGYIGFRYAWHYGTVAYFKYKCEKYGGEFIYKTVDNVEGVFQMRLRDPRDYQTRLLQGDIPDDPYGHSNWEAQTPQTLFVDPSGARYRFLETTKVPDVDRMPSITKIPHDITFTGEKYWRYSVPDNSGHEYLEVEQTSTLKSKYGFTWREVRTFWDRFLGVWGGELIVTTLDDQEILGIRKGYFYWNRFSDMLRWCPIRGREPTFTFLTKVLHPTSEK
jgi:hypothetical protein